MSEAAPVSLADARPRTGFKPSWPEITGPSPVDDLSALAGEDPYAAGYREGRREAEADFAGEREQFRALLASCEALQPEPSDELALLIAELVERLVRTTVGEVAIDIAKLAERAHRSAALVADANAARTLHLHPDDVALAGADAWPLTVVIDDTVPRGSLRIEDSTGWVEDGVGIYLDALRERLGLKEGGQ